ncbi:MAG TPA: helix-turn-helix transcriptional regulator [Ktedonobacteraceae bacterium]|nr:helix-turn-helix transcriptional regulator [Ktedonobacteraceae bacterium]
MDISSSVFPNDRLRRERIRHNWRQQDLANRLGTTVVTVKRWERGSQQPGAYYRVKLCALFGKSVEELGFVSTQRNMVQPSGIPSRLDASEASLSATEHEFAHTDHHETKMSTSVARVSLTQAAFHLSFSRKEAIFTELIADLRARMRVLADASRLRPGLTTHELPQKVQAVMKMGFRFLAENADLAFFGLFLAPEAEEIKAEIVGLVAANLRTEQHVGYLRSQASPEIVAECLVSMMLRLAQSHLFPGKQSPDSLGAQVADLILHGILDQSEL